MADTNVKMACVKYEPVLEDYLEGVLDEAGAEAARRHLQDCAGCSAALDRATGSVRLLQILEPSAGAGCSIHAKCDGADSFQGAGADRRTRGLLATGGGLGVAIRSDGDAGCGRVAFVRYRLDSLCATQHAIGSFHRRQSICARAGQGSRNWGRSSNDGGGNKPCQTIKRGTKLQLWCFSSFCWVWCLAESAITCGAFARPASSRRIRSRLATR